MFSIGQCMVKNSCWLLKFCVLFILAFSSSVRCSVLVLMTTFTLFTLKTWEKAPKLTVTCDHKQAMQISLALHCGSNYKYISNFCKPLLQIRWQPPFFHFSSPKSRTYSCKNTMKKKNHTLHLSFSVSSLHKREEDSQDTCWWNQSTVNFLFQINAGLSQTTFTQDKYSYCCLLS